MSKKLDDIIGMINELDEKARLYRTFKVKEAKKTYDEYVRLIVYEMDVPCIEKDNLMDYWHRVKKKGHKD